MYLGITKTKICRLWGTLIFESSWLSVIGKKEIHSDLTRPGGYPHMEWMGKLVVSLRDVDFGFWSRLGCSGQNAIIFSRQGLVKGYTRKNHKTEIILMLYIYSFRGLHNLWPRPDWSLLF